MMVTFQDLQEEEINPKDTDSPSLDPPLSEGYPPGLPLDPGGPELVKYILGQDIFTPWLRHLQMQEMTSKFLSIFPQQMKCDILAFKTVYSKYSLIHTSFFGLTVYDLCIPRNQGYLPISQQFWQRNQVFLDQIPY